MNRTAAAFPVLPGKDASTISELLRSQPNAYKESRNNAGVALERAYLQSTPMGDFVIVYFESEAPAGEALAKAATSGLEIDQEFVRLVNEIHGVDLGAPPEGPAPETIAEWFDSGASGRGRGLAFCAPVIPGQEDAGRAFAKEAFEGRRDELEASRRALRQWGEVVTLQATPQGSIVCVYLEGEDPGEGNRGFAASKEPYDLWFKDQLKTIFPPEIDFDQPLPPIKEIFDSETIR